MKRDIYGFTNKSKEKQDEKQDDTDRLNYDLFIDKIKNIKLGYKRAKEIFYGEIIWGNDKVPGCVSLEFSPHGSDKIIIRKLIENEIFITKKVINNQDIYTEDLLQTCYQVLLNIDKQIDSTTNKEYKIENLIKALSNKTKIKKPKVMFYDKCKKINENHYIIAFNLKGYGVESPGASRVEQFHINIFYDENNKIIRCWGCDISSPTRQHKWQSQPSEFDEKFSPSQKQEEIIECIMNLFMSY